MTTSLNIVLKRPSKIYHEGETIAGVVAVSSGAELRHEGLSLLVEGAARVVPQGRPPELINVFASNVKELGLIGALPTISKLMWNDMTVTFHQENLRRKICPSPIPMVHTSLELLPAGRLPPGLTEVPFEVPLTAIGGTGPLLETYHGVFINVCYRVRATLKLKAFLSKPLNDTCQFFVQLVPSSPPPLKPVRCEVSPGCVRGAGGGGALPHFVIYAELHSTVCSLDRPITGKIRVEESACPVKSIELQLVRVESIAAPPLTKRDATEIQNIQIGCGDVVRARDIPLYMVLPRLFTAPTAAKHCFTIGFELNIAVIFEDDHVVTENFPILLLRTS